MSLHQHDRRECNIGAVWKERATKPVINDEGSLDLPGFKPHGGTIHPDTWAKLSYRQQDKVTGRHEKESNTQETECHYIFHGRR